MAGLNLAGRRQEKKMLYTSCINTLMTSDYSAVLKKPKKKHTDSLTCASEEYTQVHTCTHTQSRGPCEQYNLLLFLTRKWAESANDIQALWMCVSQHVSLVIRVGLQFLMGSIHLKTPSEDLHALM